MEIFFTNSNFKIGGTSFTGVPFFVDSKFKLIDEINEFFTHDLLLDGRIGSTKTWKSYAYWLLDYLKWAEANGIKWKFASELEILAYRNWSLEECNLFPTTVNSRITVLKRFYAYAKNRNFVNSNPIIMYQSNRYVQDDSNLLSHTHKISVKRNSLSVKVNHELPKTFSENELIRIFSAVCSDRLKLMMRLMLECGLRRREVALLPEELIDHTIKLAHNSGPNSEVPFRLPSKICKGNKSRTVFISYSTAMRLMQYKNTIRPKLLKKFKLKNKTNPEAFWLTNLGSEFQPESLSIEINALGKSLKIDANPHKFRHTFATNYYAITRDLRQLQKILGHSNIETTTIYEHTVAIDHYGFLSEYQKKLDQLLIMS